MTSSSSTVPGAATATTTHPGSSTHRWESSCTCAAPRSRREGSSLPDDCLFCNLARDGEHVRKGDGFVAIRDINPAPVPTLLGFREGHVPPSAGAGGLGPAEPNGISEFVGDPARDAGSA